MFDFTSNNSPLSEDRSSTSCSSTESLVTELWTSREAPDQNVLGDCYLRYFKEQCNIMLLHDGARSGTIVRDAINVMRDLRSDLDRNKVRARIKTRIGMTESDDDASCLEQCGTDDIAEELIDLAVRLLVMMPIGGFRQLSAPGRSLKWTSGSLKEMLCEQFHSQPSVKGSVKLERFFNARSLERIAGMKIVWTSNLLDHLKTQDDDMRVSIYHHASFLEHHRHTDIFPPGLIDETLRTLALLLPRHDKAVQKWYRNQSRLFKLDTKSGKRRPLSTEDRQLEHFKYWHDRILILKEVFDDTEPSTMRQWWEDRRRRVQWYTFWVAFFVLGLTIFFGTLQTIEGALQVWKAYNPGS